MKFCMITTFYPPYHFGGDATYVYRLTQQLAARGHRVDVIHDRDAYHLAHPAEPEPQYGEHPNVRVHPLKSWAGVLSVLATHQTGRPFLKPEIKRLLTSGNYDVIHFHNISLIGPGAFDYGRAIKLYTTHEHWLLCPLSLLWKYDRELCTEKECVRCTLHAGRPPQWWRYTGFLARQLSLIDRFISPSRFTRDKHREQGVDVPFTVLPYFLPRDAGSGEDEPRPHPRPYFLFVGRLVKIKGLQTILPIFKSYTAADLVVAGAGDYESELKTLAGEAPNIHFVGTQSQDRLRALYRHAIALIMPSICFEVFGIVLIEAFAMKTPVIVRDLGGMAEVVADSSGGFVFRGEEELPAIMARLQQDPELRRRLGENGHDAYVRLWSEGPHLNQYFEIIREIADRRGLSLTGST